VNAGALFTHSIRWRWQLWLAFLLICVLTGFGATVNQLQRVNQLTLIDDAINRRITALTRSLKGWTPQTTGGEIKDRVYDFESPPEVRSLFDETRPDYFYYSIWYLDGTLLEQTANTPANITRPIYSEDRQSYPRPRGRYREWVHFTERGNCIVVGRSTEMVENFVWGVMAAGGTILGLGLGVGWWLTERAIRPVEKISAAASRISAGHLSERIETANPRDELGRLAGVLNSTFARLESAFAQQKQFTADASHELRTPLTVLIMETQNALERPRTEEEYRETVENCQQIGQEMRRLTESLLDLAHFDAGQEEFAIESVDLAEKAQSCVDQVVPLADEHKVTIKCQLQDAHTEGNPERLRQVIINLLTNAIYYNKKGGLIVVKTGTEGDFSFVSVRDTGQGMAPEVIPHIFKRFYRADKSRSKKRGGNGLGLAICKAIADAHHGVIEVQSKVGEGSTFILKLPKQFQA